MDIQLLDVLSKGTVLGLAAGFSPGPLTFLVISETLRHGLRAGVRVSLAPVLTDIPIIVLAVLLLDRLLAYPAVYGIIALGGGMLLLYLGIGSLRISAVELQEPAPQQRSLWKGVATNLLNPNPYVFWISVGTPIILDAFQIAWTHAAAFAAAFFFFIVGAKMLLAKMVDGSRAFLRSRAYLWIMRVLGALLVIYALTFLRDGLVRLEIWTH
ncbi:MAG: LysE family translocator [Hyphomicrobiales bacterium]